MTHKRASFLAPMKVIGSEGRQHSGRHTNNFTETLACRFEDTNERFHFFGPCEFLMNSLQCIRLCTIISIIREISKGGLASNL